MDELDVRIANAWTTLSHFLSASGSTAAAGAAPVDEGDEGPTAATTLSLTTLLAESYHELLKQKTCREQRSLEAMRLAVLKEKKALMMLSLRGAPRLADGDADEVEEKWQQPHHHQQQQSRGNFTFSAPPGLGQADFFTARKASLLGSESTASLTSLSPVVSHIHPVVGPSSALVPATSTAYSNFYTKSPSSYASALSTPVGDGLQSQDKGNVASGLGCAQSPKDIWASPPLILTHESEMALAVQRLISPPLKQDLPPPPPPPCVASPSSPVPSAASIGSAPAQAKLPSTPSIAISSGASSVPTRNGGGGLCHFTQSQSRAVYKAIACAIRRKSTVLDKPGLSSLSEVDIYRAMQLDRAFFAPLLDRHEHIYLSETYAGIRGGVRRDGFSRRVLSGIVEKLGGARAMGIVSLFEPGGGSKQDSELARIMAKMNMSSKSGGPADASNSPSRDKIQSVSSGNMFAHLEDEEDVTVASQRPSAKSHDVGRVDSAVDGLIVN